jgi:NAD(P)-dependent dehydrogenase (short-subunit alcohol dehydrogenase family)
VVTGAAGGVGKAVAGGILTAGGAVAMIDVKPEPEDLGRITAQPCSVTGDLNSSSRFDALVAEMPRGSRR